MSDAIITKPLSYVAGGADCHGYLALPAGPGPHPGVLVAPAFGGLSDSDRAVADRLAGLGYAALGVDYYSGGAYTQNRDEASALMQGMQNDRPLLAARMQGALAALAGQEQVDAARLGAMGFCFGGKAVLDLARSGADFRAGVTFHGVYDAPASGSQTMKPAMLILHGWDDPLATPEQTVALAAELTAHCGDWQLLGFGHTGHGFTNVNAKGPGMGYSEAAATRGWANMLQLFADKLV
jgi:dienelactone hydrolase